MHVNQASLKAAPGRSHSAPTSSQKTIRYSPVKHLSRKQRKASKSMSSTHQLSSKSANPSGEPYPQPHHAYEIIEKSLTSNTENNKHSRPNRNQSEVPSIPELTDEANEGSDYESSDFVDSPDRGISGYASMKISCATQTPISSNNLESSNVNKQLFAHPNQRPNDLLTASISLPSAPETLQKNLAGESQNTPDPNINYTKSSDSSSTIFSSQTSPIQGKIVGVRIRNGVVEYQYKFPTVWKSSNELEDQETLIQNFMDTLTSKTSLVRVTSITSNDSSIQH
ncbi:hypothetical protein K7432_012818 [Basidiobolus ranarum]|uniref:Uncharacterized protein n=1 Tax=Basidiobolus ranarum TaxID=34480 RepID=A0ABR2WK80_9FUNG